MERERAGERRGKGREGGEREGERGGEREKERESGRERGGKGGRERETRRERDGGVIIFISWLTNSTVNHLQHAILSLNTYTEQCFITMYSLTSKRAAVWKTSIGHRTLS